MLKGEHCGESKKQPLVSPIIQGVFKKSSSPVQTAKGVIKNPQNLVNPMICKVLCF